MAKTFACDATTGRCSPDPRGSLTQQNCEASCDVAPPPCAGASDTCVAEGQGRDSAAVLRGLDTPDACGRACRQRGCVAWRFSRCPGAAVPCSRGGACCCYLWTADSGGNGGGGVGSSDGLMFVRGGDCTSGKCSAPPTLHESSTILASQHSARDKVPLPPPPLFSPGDGSWSTIANMTTPRTYGGAVAIGGSIGRVYVMGGLNSSQGATLKSAEVFNAIHGGSWSRIDDMPVGRAAMGTVQTGSKIYVMGGLSDSSVPLKSGVVFDPSSKSTPWSPIADMATARRFPGAVSLNGIVYIMGGDSGPGTPSLKSCEMYSPATNSWSSAITDMSVARNSMGASTASTGSKVCVLGGNDAPPHPFLHCECYDPVTNSWNAIAPLLSPRRGMGTATLGGAIYIVGGFGTDEETAPFSDVDTFQRTTRSWNALNTSMAVGRRHPSAAVLYGKIYVVGGDSHDPDSSLASVEVFAPPPPLGNACTGNSMQLPAAECSAWIEFYDITKGGDWTHCSDKRTDPCSCNESGRFIGCLSSGTALVTL
jgi:N-acetylneuraminic acid mutarotase